MRVFISSTCYDLVDLRSELEVFFRDAGADPILSDSLSSEFEVLPDRNSIETCLANVRSCDQFIIVLSNRYGPSLASRGFEDLSATHLEYREAIKCKKPVRMFVRDRLEADYTTWKSNHSDPNIKLPWCKEEHDRRVFTLLQEHRGLHASSTHSNWLWPFRDSAELKRHLAREFKELLARTMVEKLFLNGRLPFFDVSTGAKRFDGRFMHFDLIFRNLGNGTAVAPTYEVENTNNKWDLSGLGPTEQFTINIHWAHHGSTVTLNTRLTYSIIEGHVFKDLGVLKLSRANSNLDITYTLMSRRYVGVSNNILMA